jgi:hypothetical protein
MTHKYMYMYFLTLTRSHLRSTLRLLTDRLSIINQHIPDMTSTEETGSPQTSEKLCHPQLLH